jgi:hypothetical protein
VSGYLSQHLGGVVLVELNFAGYRKSAWQALFRDIMPFEFGALVSKLA